MKQGRTSVITVCAIFFGGVIASAQQVVDLSLTNNPGGSAFQWVGPRANAQAGATLIGADMSGDINRHDLLVGAPGGPSDPGQAFIEFVGPPHTLDVDISTRDVVATGENAGDRFGSAIAAGFVLTQDVSGARFKDLIVGAPNAFGGNGAVYLFAGPMTTNSHLSASSATARVIGRTGDHLGDAVAVVDIDGDGYRDLVMAAPGSGNVYVLFGGRGMAGTVDLATNPSFVQAMSVGAAGRITLAGADFNADG